VDAQNCPGSTFLVADPIADGTHTARLTATDAAGNSAGSTFQFTLDSTLPQLTYSGFENDRTTNPSPSMEFWASDAHSVTTRCAYDAAAWEELVDCSQGPDHAPAAPLTPGTHVFWITATDSFGNVASTTYTFEVVAPGQGTPAGEKPGGSTGDNGGTGKAIPRVSVVSRATKVKRGKFSLTAAVTLTPATATATCDGSVVVTLTPKVKKAKAVKTTVKLTAKAGNCVGKAKFKLASKLKKKKAGIAVSFAGNTSMAQFTSTPLNVKL
ncbi:MAG: Ig-like domain-containing protein, partial [Solirubrobacterales bacterium]